MANVDISGLNKAEVLAGLFNHSKPQGLGYIHFQKRDMGTEEAQSILDSGQTYFDYLEGRVMKVNLENDTQFNSGSYDRDNGEGAAEFVVDNIRNGTRQIQPTPDRTLEAADNAANFGGMLRLALEANRLTDFKPITLRNGSQEAGATVFIVFDKLKALIEENPISFYELVMKARNDNHEIWGNCGKPLVEMGFIDNDGKMSQTVRNIVLSSSTGDGFDMALIGPIARSTEKRAPAQKAEGGESYTV